MSDKIGKYPSNDVRRLRYPTGGLGYRSPAERRQDAERRRQAREKYERRQTEREKRYPKQLPKLTKPQLQAVVRGASRAITRLNPFDIPVRLAIGVAEALFPPIVRKVAFPSQHWQYVDGNCVHHIGGTGRFHTITTLCSGSSGTLNATYENTLDVFNLGSRGASVGVIVKEHFGGPHYHPPNYPTGSYDYLIVGRWQRRVGAPNPAPVGVPAPFVRPGSPIAWPISHPGVLPFMEPVKAPNPVAKPSTKPDPREEPSEDPAPHPGTRTATYTIPAQAFPVVFYGPGRLGGLNPLPVTQIVNVTAPGAGVRTDTKANADPDLAQPGRGDNRSRNTVANVRVSHRAPPLSPNRRAPRGTKSKKISVFSTVPGTVLWVANQMTESLDLIDSLWNAIPYVDRTNRGNRGLDPYDKAREIYKNFQNINVADAIENLINNQIEDAFYGRVSGDRTVNQVTGKSQLGGTALPHNWDESPLPEDNRFPLPEIDIDEMTGEMSITFGKPDRRERR